MTNRSCVECGKCKKYRNIRIYNIAYERNQPDIV